MDFGSQIKQIRLEQNMTQEQFAQALHVTRQAISNWENNKNLPDIGMLLEISQICHVSLDYLIKGDDDMNNMTRKIVEDGSEMKRARLNLVSTIIGAALLLLGIVFLIIKAMSVEYIDAQGILHENFFLLPIGFLCIFCGLVVFLSIGIRAIAHAMRH